MTPDIDVAFSEGIIYDETEIYALINSAVKQTTELASLKFEENAELSVLIADDQILQTLNKDWRSKNKPTNVLSFPTDVSTPGAVYSPLLGDIVISLETAKKEADLENKSLNHHLTHLIVHGFLHLFGYDHETDKDASIMENLETRILEKLGIADPYQV